MDHRKQIGVIMPAITETLDANYLEGIYREASACRYDVIVFTCSSNMQKLDMPTAYVLAEESIYRLAAHIGLDGLIVAAGKYHNAHVADRILQSLRGVRFPCLCTYYPNDDLPNVEVPQGDSIRAVTEHLIGHHGYRRIFCLTGPQGFAEAEERLAGWRNAMTAAGLDTSRYRYGDFWLDAPARLEQLSGRDRMTGMLDLKGISRKLPAARTFAVILLEIGWVQAADRAPSIPPALFVANAIQMNCSEGELCFRYNKDVFGVLLPVPEGMAPERLREEWVMRFDAFIELVRQSDKDMEKPVLRIFYDILTTRDNALREQLEQMIEPHLHQQHLAPTVKGGLVQQLEEIRRQIVRTPAGPWTMDDIAAAMQISVSYFRRLYKQHFGVPFHTDLIHLRMTHAMELLRQTDMNIKMIAAQCGYTSTFHFMTAFKKETGLTATDHRNGAQKTPES